MLHLRAPRLGVAAFLLAASGAAAQGGLMDSGERVHVSAVAGHDAVAPGGQLPVAVVFEFDPEWHVHTNDPVVPPELGDASFYIKTEIKIDPAAKGALRAHPALVQWPEPVMTEVAFLGRPVRYGVFGGQAVAYLPVTVEAGALPGEERLAVLVTYQACDATTCLAPVFDEVVGLTVQVGRAGVVGTPPDPALFGAFDPAVWAQIGAGQPERQDVRFDLFGAEFTVDAGSGVGLGLLLLVAGLGGLLLNFTPCVLPLIPIKIMGLSQAAGNRRRMLGLGAVMSLGVVAFWLLLGGLVATVAGFTAANQLFQYPVFTLGVGVVIAVMAVGMTGRFSVTLPQAVYRLNPGRETVPGSFAFGILMAVLSTPCTAPFMGAAAAWAATREPAITLMTFAAIGAGMALPYLVLSAAPDLVARMPRTGPASALIKEVMGLFMLAAAAYFIGVGLSSLTVQPPDPPTRTYWVGVALFVGAGGAWLAWRSLAISRGAGRFVFAGLGALAVLASIYGATVFTQAGPIAWTYYTPQRFDEALAAGHVVVLEFTAEWCLNCKTLEESVLKTDPIVALFAEPGVVPMKVDLTGNNQAGNRKLRDVGRLTIPLLAVISPDGTETFKSDFYTVDQIRDAVARARKGPPMWPPL